MRFDLGPSLAALKVAAAADIDAQAERLRLTLITAGAGQALVYERKRAEAERTYVVKRHGVAGALVGRDALGVGKSRAA